MVSVVVYVYNILWAKPRRLRVKYTVFYCTLWTPGSIVHCLFCKIYSQSLITIHPIHPLQMHVYLTDKFSLYNLKMANI